MAEASRSYGLSAGWPSCLYVPRYLNVSGHSRTWRTEIMWKYREPSPEDFETEEEYREALAAYEYAEEQYLEDCRLDY